LLVVVIALAISAAFLPKSTARWVTALGGVLTMLAIASGVARDWERWGFRTVRRHPLTLIGASLAFIVAGEVLHATGAEFPSTADAVSMTAYPLVLVGLLRLTRARISERPLDTLLVAAIVPVSLIVFGWLPLTDALQQWVPVTHRGSWLPATFLAVDALAIAMTARLALMFRGKPIGYHLLLGAFAAMLGAHTARAASALTDTVAAPVGTQSLLLLGFGLMGTAALHPSLRLGTTFRARPLPLGRAHLVLLGAAVTVGPVAVVVHYGHEGGWVFLAAGGPAVVSLLVMAHLWRIVLERSRLEHLSLHDPLTGLPNRVHFHGRLEQAIARAEAGDQFAVGLLDLDRFKNINDSLGHAAGDEMLQQVAARLQGAARHGDSLARLAGDEFAFLLPGVGEDTAHDVSTRLHEVFRDRFHLAGRDVFMSPSIGVATYPAHGQEPDTLLRHADDAMYQAKSVGRDAVEVYTDRLSAHAHHDLALETALHGALERGEFVLYYQPKLRLDNGALVGVEALVRWNHPGFGLIPPGAFIHFAEESGLIAPLGHWVLRQACRQASAWLAEGARVPVSVNLSARQFQLQDLSTLVGSVLDETGLPSELLELELTESVSLDEQGPVLSTLANLRDLGVRCSIDDFGTGYSGLGYLSRYPIDSLKLDRSFVSAIGDGDAPIVRAIIAMAHSLNLEVIAEGVETPAQAAFLRGQRCDVLQGYLASEPLPPDEVLSGVRTWTTQAARSWEHDASGGQLDKPAGLGGSVWWSEELLGEMLASLEPSASTPEPERTATGAKEPALSGRSHVQRTLVLTSAASVLTLPVFLGLGAASALPPKVQAVVTAGLSTIRATTPDIEASSTWREGADSPDTARSSSPTLRAISTGGEQIPPAGANRSSAPDRATKDPRRGASPTGAGPSNGKGSTPGNGKGSAPGNGKGSAPGNGKGGAQGGSPGAGAPTGGSSGKATPSKAGKPTGSPADKAPGAGSPKGTGPGIDRRSGATPPAP
jgi:diguanylate cyclase (GGDEF)-like protein